MAIRAWRLVASRWQGSAFSGEGARLAGGRWNSKGTAVVYLGGSLALAALELLVHIDHSRALVEHVAIPVEFDESSVQVLEEDALPEDFPAAETIELSRSLGDAWVRTGEAPVLRVPSAVIPQEFNYLLNPSHERFREVTVGEPQPFRYDSRLIK